MPQWLVFAVIALVWALVVIVIVVFMMGASRARRKQLEHDRATAEQPVATKDN